MAVTVGELLFKLGADTSGLTGSLRTAEGQVKKTGEALEQTGRKGQDGLGKVGKGAKDADREIDRLGKTTDDARAKVIKFGVQAIAAFAIADVIKDSIQAATDLGESINLTGNIFKQNKDEILEWSKTSAEAFGLSQSAALSAASTFGGLFQNMNLDLDTSTQYSQDLVTLAGDLASAFNTEVPDAVQALSSALRGETEPIRRYNVMLSDSAIKAEAVRIGMYSGRGEIDLAAKAQASYNLILAQTVAAQGDFANTAEDPANAAKSLSAQVTDLKAKFGEDLLPLWKDVLSTASNIASWVSDNKELVKTLALVAGGLWAASKAGAAWNLVLAAMARNTKAAATVGAADFVMGTGIVAPAGRVAGARGALAATGATGVIAAGAAAGGMTYALASNMGETFGGSDRGKVLTDFAGGSQFNGGLLGYSQNVLGFIGGGLLDEFSGKTAVEQMLNADLVAAEAAEMNKANRERARIYEESKETLEAMTKDAVAQGLITSKQALEILEGTATSTIEEIVAANEAAEKAMEATWNRRKRILDQMNIIDGAPAMTKTVTEQYTEIDPETGKEVTKTREVEQERAKDPRDVLRSAKEAVAYQDQLTADLKTLRRRGATAEAIAGLLDVEANAPGTIRKVAEDTGKGYMKQLNEQFIEGGRLTVQQDRFIENAVSIWDRVKAEGERRARRAGKASRDAYNEGLGDGEGEPTGPVNPLTWFKQPMPWNQLPGPGATASPTYINIDKQTVRSDDPERFGRATREASRRRGVRGRGR